MMLGRKFFKTKLCKLYQGGRCPRQNCSFAHGNAELRQGPPPFNDRRDYRNGDLRDKLDRRHSPYRRHSPGRDARGYHGFHSQKPASHDRGYSVSRSPVKRSERRYKKRQPLDGESDDSGSFKISNGAEDRKKDDKVSSYDEKDVLGEQLKQLQLELDMLGDHKTEVEILLEERVDEVHKLSSKIEDLERQLNKEQDDCKRITSKIRKFVKAHGRFLKAQEELKRSEARLQRLGDQLGSDPLKANATEEDSSINVASDFEPNDDGQRSPRNDELQNTSIKKKHVYSANNEDMQIVAGNFQKRKKFSGVISRSEKFKLTRLEGPVTLSENDATETEVKKVIPTRRDVHKSLADEYKHKRGKNTNSSIVLSDKAKGSEVGRSLPSTSMAAHAIDELIEAIEMDEKYEAVEATANDEIGAVGDRAVLSYLPPPPPPVNQNAYKQYEVEDEDADVDVEKVDAEMLDIDINSEVEIEQV